ncbi:MAG: hypothetical protein GXO84_02295 [Chlorobi bacterium]|nr:hypothetical protein [Chlorobiota bacterium]
MLNSRTLNFALILIGGIVAVYAESNEKQNTYILLGGIMLLMIGLYRLSKGIPSKNKNEDNTFIEEEE